ncbi:MAG TPA: hypothetical protein VK978_02505 [Candidatus Saccharimonadales bacterium]|nr:hypothetical protein [Candidatus Saccharimonadales bacterium]
MAHESTHSSNSHKETGGEVISPEAWQQRLDDEGLAFEGDALTEGGLIRRARDNTYVGWVLPPRFRRDQHALRSKDIKQLVVEDRPDPEYVALDEIRQGIELELYGYGPVAKDMAPIMTDEAQQAYQEQVPRLSAELFGDSQHRWDVSPELLQSCIELNLPNSPDRAMNAARMVERLKLVERATSVVVPGSMIVPVSTLPHRELRRDDLTTDPYVRGMALNFMGWDKARQFTSTSMQGHSEGLARTAILSAINQYQHVSPLMYGLTLAAPFTHGWPSGLSGRYRTRIEGSPSAGVFVEPLPTDVQEYYERIAQPQLKAGETPSPIRGAGQHRDRPRFDLPPYGTIESCEGDTAGASPIKMVAIQYLRDTVLWKLQRHHITGDMSHYERYPRIFGSPSHESYAWAHYVSMEVAQHGLSATVIGRDGQEHRARDLMADLRHYAEEPVFAPDRKVLFRGLPPRVRQEIVNSSWEPGPDLFAAYRRGGAVDAIGYYETGIGTLAHWQQARYRDLRAAGPDRLSHDAALHNSLRNIGESWRTTIRGLSPAAAAVVVAYGLK